MSHRVTYPRRAIFKEVENIVGHSASLTQEKSKNHKRVFKSQMNLFTKHLLKLSCLPKRCCHDSGQNIHRAYLTHYLNTPQEKKKFRQCDAFIAFLLTSPKIHKELIDSRAGLDSEFVQHSLWRKVLEKLKPKGHQGVLEQKTWNDHCSPNILLRSFC